MIAKRLRWLVAAVVAVAGALGLAHVVAPGTSDAAAPTSDYVGCPVVFVTAVPGVSGDPAAELATLPVVDEDRQGEADYARQDWLPGWASQGHGRDTRDVVLERDRCRDGGWVSPWDGARVGEARRVDIDHVVPLGEAARSGSGKWTSAQRHQFANDPANLRAVSAHANRSKGDGDPARWRPEDRTVWCAYAGRVVAIKLRYHLSVDGAESKALLEMFGTCNGKETQR